MSERMTLMLMLLVVVEAVLGGAAKLGKLDPCSQCHSVVEGLLLIEEKMVLLLTS